MDSKVENQINEFEPDNLGLSEEEQKFVNELQGQTSYSKGDIILSEGQITNMCFHIVEGCVRKYYLKDGEEKTTDFYIENDSISTKPSGTKQIKSKYYLECVEDTVVTTITSQQEELLYTKFPRFQGMCRISTEHLLDKYQEKFSKFISSSPEERYLHLQETRPDLLNRVPQYQLASYLGIKPESLSRIRKRLMS